MQEMGGYPAAAGATMAMAGATLLGAGFLAAWILPLGVGDPDQMHRAKIVWDDVHDGLQAHSAHVSEQTGRLVWEGTSRTAGLDPKLGTYLGQIDRAALAPRATAGVMETSARTYRLWGLFAFLLGGAMLRAGIMAKVAESNPFSAPVGRSGAFLFGAKADGTAGRQAGNFTKVVELATRVLGSGARRLMMGGSLVVAAGAGANMLVGNAIRRTAIHDGAGAASQLAADATSVEDVSTGSVSTGLE